jgi:thiamine-monophosphate kinase
LIGGDTVATDGPLTLALTALGEVAVGQALLRSGARTGDGIFVSGAIGDGALGLMACQGRLPEIDTALQAALVERYRLPTPRLSLGARLIGLAHAAIDVSDGLIADLGHICDCSGVGAEIDAALVPVSEAGRAALAVEPGLLAAMLIGGDDYELLFTAAEDAAETIGALGTELSLDITRIGTTTSAPGVKVIGDESIDAGGGYRHFS